MTTGVAEGRRRRVLLRAGCLLAFLALALLSVPTPAARWILPCVAALWLVAVLWEGRPGRPRGTGAWGPGDQLRLAVVFLVAGILASLAVTWLSALPGSSAL